LAYACWTCARPGRNLAPADLGAQGYKLLLNEQRLLVKVLHIARDDDPLRQQQSPRRRSDLRRWLNQPANTVLLANGLAMSAQESWTARTPALAVPDQRCTCNSRWKRCSSRFTSKPPTAPATP
jgi:hypothetical protein